MLPGISSGIVPKQANVPGGVVVINLNFQSEQPPIVLYQGQRTLVLPDPQNAKNWLTVVGIPLTAKLGTNEIQINSEQQNFSRTFEVKEKKYKQEKLFFADAKKVQPDEADLPLISAQYLETIATYNVWEYKPLDSLKLKLPVKGRKSSPFGLSRIINNVPKDPHSGLDIAAPLGTAVHAAKAGKVINVGKFYFSGNIVFVDHGQGFITSYCHLDSVAVKKDQIVEQGTIIGTIGRTGRATGPHLHWSVSLNGVRVDPQLFINE